ncbi:MAG: hypothetical protein R3D31_02575 [Hyphomicrobiaceae bacterium]
MNVLKRCALAAALAVFASGSAVALEETRGGPKADTEGGPVIRLTPPSDAPGKIGAGLDISVGGKDAKGKGTEVRVPGLGKLGVLPKLDFGLELLYGAAEPKVREDEKGPEDLTIRGSLKKKF